jgi:hypothetical protein
MDTWTHGHMDTWAHLLPPFHTLIFIPILTLTCSPETLFADLGYGLVIYVLLTVFRAIVMYGAIPLFRNGHYGCASSGARAGLS